MEVKKLNISQPSRRRKPKMLSCENGISGMKQTAAVCLSPPKNKKHGMGPLKKIGAAFSLKVKGLLQAEDSMILFMDILIYCLQLCIPGFYPLKVE